MLCFFFVCVCVCHTANMRLMAQIKWLGMSIIYVRAMWQVSCPNIRDST